MNSRLSRKRSELISIKRNQAHEKLNNSDSLSMGNTKWFICGTFTSETEGGNRNESDQDRKIYS